MKKLLLLLFLIPNLVMAENVIYCEDELVTGISKDHGVWKTIDLELERHSIKFNDDYTKLDGLPGFYPMSCSKPYSIDSNYIACVHSMGSHETFTFNKLTKRFLYSNTKVDGYVDNGYDINFLRAGTCEAF